MNFAAFQLETGLAALVILLLILDGSCKQSLHVAKGYAAGIVGLGILLILSFTYLKTPVVIPEALIQLDTMALGFKRMFLALGLGFFIINQNWIARRRDNFISYQSIFLLSLIGMMLSSSVNNLLMMFLTMEIVAVSFYVMVGYNKKTEQSLEAGVKYLIMAGLASAIMIMGIAFVYGISGTLDFNELAEFTPDENSRDAYWMGIILIVAGLGFKISAFPFQYWAPDVYQGTSAPTTGMLASASKAVGFILLARFACAAMPLGSPIITTFWAILAASSILYGNLCAIPQRDIKRLIAFSGIANAGYMMLAFSVGGTMAMSAMFYYLIVYVFSILGAFLAISLIETEVGSTDMDALSCLPQRAPFAGFLLAVSMASMAGIPPLAGFMGKFLLLKALFITGMADTPILILAIVALIGIIISIYYYFLVIRCIYWPANQAYLLRTSGSKIFLTSALYLAGVISLIMMILPGIYPELLLDGTDWMASTLGELLQH